MQRTSARYIVLAVLLLPIAISRNIAFAHCEIPCGVYDDEMRFDMIVEHIATVEKSMNTILELQEEERTNYNQLVRWVNNKENHADKIQNIICQYLMTQRVKPVGKEDNFKREIYVKQITLLHEMLILAMKMKQTTDLTHTAKLRSLLKEFKLVYLSGAR